MPATNLRAGASEHDYGAAWLLYLASATLEDISTQLDIPYSTLAAFASRHSWKNVRVKALESARRAIKEDLTRRVEKHKTKHQHFVLDQLDHVQSHIENMAIGENKDEGEVAPERKLQLLRQHDDIARRTLGLDKEETNNIVAQGFAMLIATRQAENTPSAMMPLLEQSEALPGILSPFKGLENGTTKLANDAIEVDSEVRPTGPADEGTKLPSKLSFKAPYQPLGNESAQQTGEDEPPLIA